MRPLPAPSSPIHRLVALVLVALGLGLAGAPAAGAAVFGSQGLSAGSGSAQQRADRSLDLAARAGAKVFRVQADWSALEPRSSGERDGAALAGLDRVIDGIARRRMRAVLVLTSTPCWASSSPEAGACDGPGANREAVTRFQPRDPAAVVPIATFLASRYASRLAAFQVWNEPDHANEKYWAGPDKARNYVAMVRAVYGPLKQAAPRVPVIVGSFVGTNGKWLQAMYDAGIKGFYDGLAVQFYSFTLYGLRATRAVQRRNGDRKPLWLTEFGYTSCYRKGGPRLQIDQPCRTAAGAARGLTDVITGVRRLSWVAAAIQYNIADDGPGGYTFGLFTAGGRAKASYTAVRRVVTGRVRSPKRPTVRLRRAGKQVVLSGTASITEVLTVTVKQRGALRFRAQLVTDRLNRYRLALPPELGTRGLVVRVSAGYTGSRSGRI